jgi:hypothetical protein
MLSIFGKPARLCDGVTRRSFLQIGALSFGGLSLSLADILRTEARASETPRSRPKSVINIFLGGGPPHQDMWDIKTEAPSEIRGEFRPIATRVNGIQIGEVFPRIAAQMDKIAVIRSVVGAFGGHDGFQCMTGWTPADMRSVGGRPGLGSAVAKIQGAVDPGMPPFVGLAAPTGEIRWSDPGKPGFLGPAYGAFKPDGPALANMRLNGTTLDNLADRRRMLTSFDSLRREVDVTGQLQGLDAFTQQAFDVLTSSRLLDALDLTKESERVRDRYGDGKPFNYQYDGAPTVNEHLLMARRLVEAGARVVSLSFGRWDSHSNNFELVRDHGGKLDQALSALIEDLHDRGLEDDVTVIAWGEFGRTPRINNNAGRDHWPEVSCALLAGGGMRTGQVIGATNHLGERAVQRPVHFQEIFATLYHNLGINTQTTTLRDPTGRPQYLVERPLIQELVG